MSVPVPLFWSVNTMSSLLPTTVAANSPASGVTLATGLTSTPSPWTSAVWSPLLALDATVTTSLEWLGPWART